MLETAGPAFHWLYREYFRADVFDIENVPEGRVLLISNHSGQLPFDGAMIGMSMLLDRDPPRATRGMVEHFVPTVPFVGTLFSRVGQVVGTPANARRLLDEENCVLVFPEGSRGISKTFGRRYQLERFGTGFMRLALETGTPIVPVGVVGAEEQYISVADVRPVAKLLNAPSFPLLLNVLPLPSKYRIYFGEPLRFEGDHEDEDRVIRDKVRSVRRAIEALLRRGLREREAIYW